MAGYWRNIIIFSFVFVTGFSTNYGCSIEDVGGWTVPQVITILDVFRGNIFDRSTSDIEGIASPVFATGLNGGPYLSVSYANSRFVIATNDAFEDYEEYETEDNMSVTVIFRCTGGGTRTLVFIIQVQDTNNNSPRFLPSNEFAYTILTPAAPGITVTGCFDGITVRDIDLTTERIDFTIEENPFIEIAYDAASSTTDKEFIGILRTKTFIRSLSEPITLRITATDVDRTNDPPRTTTGTVTIKADSAFQFPEEPVFSQTFYLANYVTSANGDQIVLSEPIILQSGFHESVIFILEGEFSNNFALTPSGSQMSLIVRIPLESNVLRENQILLVVRANREHTSGGSATIVVQLPEGIPLEFERAHYEGTIKDDILLAPQLILARGYEGETVHTEIFGEHALYFSSSIQGNTITLSMPALPAAIINENNVLSLEVVASTESDSAKTIVTLEIISDDNDTPVFNRPMYTGSYNIGTGLTLEQIVFDQGYDETVGLSLEGDHAGLFTIGAGRVVTITTTGIPPTMFSEQRIVLTLRATKPRTVGANTAIIISLPADLQTDEDVSFNRLVYEGIIRLSEVQHESIIISNFDGDNVQLHGEHSSLFEARLLNGVVTIHAVGSLSFLAGTLVTLELHAGRGRAVLLLNVLEAGAPALPTVTFSSPSYIFNVEIVQTGVIGRVLATADNGEAVAYSLAIENAHLQARVSINNEGEVHLSAPANSGVYTFQVIATTVITRAEGTATIHLTVESVTVCGDDITVPPLIILDRDEEEPHNNLVTLDRSQHEGCRYTLTNRWPLDQNWLYVDDNGLHARSIDREHESIAYMALSQVQVELILHCEGDSAIRAKRSQRLDWLGPYDYGLNQWILTESIPYNARRSRVNLIVNDINDNVPIFVGKESEPIAVGYPIPDIEERILPRSLAELQATDADVGLNAALKYWSSEDVLAVAPTSGFVHVRTGARLLDNQRLTVSATDRNGEGLTGEILLLVKLLDLSNIVVVTVKNAFLDDEKTILSRLSEVIGYEVKALRSVVISDDQNEDSRKKRETSTTGASLMIYMYGLIQREPVSVDRLTTDIYNNAAVINVISTVSLEDHLEPTEIIITKSSIGLLVATIVLGVLLFIIILVIAIWFFLKWRKNKNYNQFTDQNSLASRNSSEDKSAELEVPKTRLNIEELKKSENRLQERLKVPIQDVTIEAVPPRREGPLESIIDLPPPDSSGPIVIQSIDKLKDADESDTDEFGEKPGPRRKSVVTFNENVEKIIHVEDNDDDTETVSSQSSYEVYKL